MPEFVWVYITARDRSEALRIARRALKMRLAACANILSPIRSFYWWKGRLEGSKEVALVLKTRFSLLQPLVSEIKKAHSYKVPCIVALPIKGGNADFLRWIEEETGRRR
ncbi:MAG: divalent-cation tolerance protein CutA [Thermoplasmatota archaeon]